MKEFPLAKIHFKFTWLVNTGKIYVQHIVSLLTFIIITIFSFRKIVYLKITIKEDKSLF